MKEQIIGLILITIGVIINNKDVQSVWLKIIRNFTPHDTVIRNQIFEIIDNLQISLGAARVNLWQFNNGVKSEMGYSYKYGSIIFESHNSNTKSIKKLFSNVPIEDYIPFLKQLQESDKFITTSKYNTFPIITASYEMTGANTGIDYKLDSNDVYKGFLSVTFYSEPCRNGCNLNCNRNCEEIKKIAAAAAAINNRIKMLKRINK